MRRTSYKQLCKIADSLDLITVKHQYLGDRKNYYYKYSVMNKDREYLTEPMEIKKIYDFLFAKLEEQIEKDIKILNK